MKCGAQTTADQHGEVERRARRRAEVGWDENAADDHVGLLRRSRAVSRNATGLALRPRGDAEFSSLPTTSRQTCIGALPVSVYDDQIRYAVASRIYNDSMFWHYAIEVNPPIHIIVSGGRVVLTGVVASEVERRKAETLAREAFGIVVLENKLRIES